MLRRFFLYLSRSKRAQRLLLSLPGAQRAARQFIAGETLAEAVEAVRTLQAQGTLATLDHLGENVTTLEQATAARNEYLEILREIVRQKLPATISVKLSQLGLALSDDLSPEKSDDDCRRNLRALVECAQQIGDFVEVDMEGSTYTDRTLQLIIHLHQSYSAVGAVIQAYLYRSESDVRELLGEGVSVRLCKGAYNEPSSLAFPRKADVDANFLRLMRMLLESKLYHRIATHDPRVIEETKRAASELGIERNGFEFQMLYGVNRTLQERLVKDGYRLRVYVPFGRAWFPYFMRRLAERPANAWFALRSIIK
ncbi:MAG: proline dehydrogenase family protein [Acidobacteria bacterium]|nr:proline dehydrogenase family protein [Acidobacteriota bacterium]